MHRLVLVLTLIRRRTIVLSSFALAIVILLGLSDLNRDAKTLALILLGIFIGVMLPSMAIDFITVFKNIQPPLAVSTYAAKAEPLHAGIEPPEAPKTTTPPFEVPDWKRGELIYQLELPDDVEGIRSSLSQWRFVSTSQRQPSVTVSNGVIGLGYDDGVTFNQAPLQPVDNCSVECEMRILEFGRDESHWTGIRIRGFDFCYDLRLGYLVYLRKSGSVELYSPEGVIGGENLVKIPNIADNWAHIRIDILGPEIRIYVNGEPHLQVRDTTFGGKGLIFLHTFQTRSEFKNFRVYRLLRVDQP